jgi:hypothetical protein
MDGGLSCLIIATSILIIGVRCEPILVSVAPMQPGGGLLAPYYCYSYSRLLLSVTSRFNHLDGLLVQ